nr:Phospho-2-dehydro-3-deoxyheptonate aldolase, Phe-sensitive [Klebsiella pneumoniae]
MNYQNDDLRIKEINELLPPVALWKNSLLPKMLQTPLHMLAKRSIRSSKATMTVCWW